MNFVASATGAVKALLGASDWTDHFDLSRKGLQQSFVALVLTIPAFYLIAYAVQVERAKQLEEAMGDVPVTPFAIILLLYLLSFSACAYIFTMVFDQQSRFRPWVITRHWTIFWLALLTAALFGLYLVGILPFAVANSVALAAFLAVLLVDIRLGQVVVPFKIGTAILVGCVINAVALIVILMGFEQVL